MKKETPHSGGTSAFIGDLDSRDNTETHRENQQLPAIRKNAKEEIRVERSNFKGYDLVSIRIFVEGKDGQPLPTKKGVTFRLELLPEIIAALQRAQGGGE